MNNEPMVTLGAGLLTIAAMMLLAVPFWLAGRIFGGPDFWNRDEPFEKTCCGCWRYTYPYRGCHCPCHVVKGRCTL